MIEVRELVRRYGTFTAVDGLSFRVGPGEVLGLVGPNGAGKSTTLRALAGIERANGGSIALAGHDLAADPIGARQVTGYVPDDPRLFDALTVAEHLELTAALYRLGDRRDAAEALLERFELGTRRDTPVDELSLGMRQKLAICCAYLIEPAVLIFDEPLTGLDPGGIRAIRESIASRAEAGAAVIVSSHLLGLVESLCTHVLILGGGRCLLHAPIAETLRAVRGGTASGESADAAAGPARSLESVFFEITRAAGGDAPR